MRIVGGAFRNRRLASPRDGRTRPALEMLRGAIFDMLEADLPGARVLDLFAGTGSLGLEALSRGAAEATFVERARGACEVLRKNIATLGVEDRARVIQTDALALAEAALPAASFDVALLDPPFPIAGGAEVAALVARVAATWLADDGLLVLRRPSTLPASPAPAGLRRLRERRHGDSLVLIDWLARERDEGGREDDAPDS